MTAEEALEYERNGGKLYEPLDFDPKLKADNVIIIHMDATNPFPEDGK